MGFPVKETEPVKITFRKILFSKNLEFTLEREGYMRTTYIGKGKLNSLMRGLKTYGKMHHLE